MIVVGRVLTLVLILLLDQDSIELNVAVVHDEVLLHKAFETVAINDIEGTVLAETPHEVLHAQLIRLPLLDVPLYLDLGVRKLFVELFEVSLRFDHEGLFSDVGKRFLDHLVESTRLLRQLLLHSEQVPVLADGLEQVVEEVIELLSQVVPDEDNVVTQGHFVFPQGCTDGLIQDGFAFLNLLQRTLYFLLQTFLEVKLVEGTQGNHRV